MACIIEVVQLSWKVSPILQVRRPAISLLMGSFKNLTGWSNHTSLGFWGIMFVKVDDKLR